MPAEVGTAYVSIMPSAQGFPAALNNQLGPGIRGSGRRAGGVFGGAFSKAAGALAGIGVAAFLKGSVDEATEALKVGKLTAQVIKTTGGAAKITAKQVSELAGAISDKVGVDDEAIQSASNLLLTFTDVRNEVGKGNDVFNQATQLTVDMGAALKQDASAGAIQLGKALNDPIKGVTALSRVGVSFTAQQKEQIKALVEGGDKLGAQKVILAELKKEFGGAAEAQVTAADKLSVAWGNFKETIGTALLPLVEKAASGISSLIKVGSDWFDQFNKATLSPAIKEAVAWFQEHLLPVLRVVYAYLKERVVHIWNNLKDIFINHVVPAVKAVMKALGALIDYLTPVVAWALARLGEFYDFLSSVFVPILKWMFDFIKNNADWLVPMLAGLVALKLALMAFRAGGPVARALGFLPGMFNRAAIAAGGTTTAVSGLRSALLNIGTAAVIFGLAYVGKVLADAAKLHKEWDKSIADSATSLGGLKGSVDQVSASVAGLLAQNSKNAITGKQDYTLALVTMHKFTKGVLENAKAAGITGESYGKIKNAAEDYAETAATAGAESGVAKLALLKLKEAMDHATGSGDTLTGSAKRATQAIKNIPTGHKTELKALEHDLMSKLAIAYTEIKKLPKEKQTTLKANIAQAEAALAKIQSKLASYSHVTYTANVKTVYTTDGVQVGSVRTGVGANAAGGLITGPGTGTSDSILSRLSNGEYVMPADKTAQYLGLLQSMRAGKLPGFAGGGVVGGPNILMNLHTQDIGAVIAAQIKKAVAKIGASAFGFFGGGGGGSTYTGGGVLSQWIARALAIVGHPDWAPALYGLVMHESGGNPNAINNYDINAQRGDPSRGLAQTIMSTFQAYRDPNLPNNIYDPIANLVAACHYIESRYGSIYNIASYRGGTSFVGGYANGSDFIPRTGLAMVHRGEAVTPARYNPAAGGFDRQVEAFRQAMRGMSIILDGQAVGRIEAARSSRLARR